LRKITRSREQDALHGRAVVRVRASGYRETAVLIGEWQIEIGR